MLGVNTFFFMLLMMLPSHVILGPVRARGGKACLFFSGMGTPRLIVGVHPLIAAYYNIRCKNVIMDDFCGFCFCFLHGFSNVSFAEFHVLAESSSSQFVRYQRGNSSRSGDAD